MLRAFVKKTQKTPALELDIACSRAKDVKSGLAMTKIKDLHKIWSKDPDYPKDYQALEEEFTVMAAIAKARRRSGLSQTELARRMNTTQSAMARLESGRGQPSTRTLVRFAKATGHTLKISFQPEKGKR